MSPMPRRLGEGEIPQEEGCWSESSVRSTARRWLYDVHTPLEENSMTTKQQIERAIVAIPSTQHVVRSATRRRLRWLLEERDKTEDALRDKLHDAEFALRKSGIEW